MSSVISIFSTAVQIGWDYYNDRKALNATLDSIETSHLSALAESVWSFDEDQINKVLDGVSNLNDIVYLKLTMVDGSLERGKAFEGRQVTVEYELKKVDDGGDKPIYVGKLEVVASLEAIFQRMINKIFVVLTSNMVKTFLASTCILLLFNLIVTRHLAKMMEFFTSIKDGSSNQVLEISRAGEPLNREEDEVDLLATSEIL